jgi:hypothetical protein
MKNLIALLEQQFNNRIVDFKDRLDELPTLEGTLTDWYCKSLLTYHNRYRKWESTEELHTYLRKRAYKIHKKELDTEILNLTEVFTATDFETIYIVVKWTKSKGNTAATASAQVFFTDNSVAFYTSRPAGGYGYDKESSAVASALNQVQPLLKRLYKYADDTIESA